MIFQGTKNCIGETTKPPDAAYCYYKQAQILFDIGIKYHSVPAPTFQNKTMSNLTTSLNAASFLHTVLLDMFKVSTHCPVHIILYIAYPQKEGQFYTISHQNLKRSTVQQYFQKYIWNGTNVNPYLGCQFRDQPTGTCYLTRVGFCFTCYVKDSDGNTPGCCTPLNDDDSYLPGTLTSCTGSSWTDIPWNAYDNNVFDDISCYSQECRQVKYTPKEDNESCDN